MLNLIFPLLLAGAAHADDALRSKVVDLLSGIESSPTAADWSALGAGAEAELVAVFNDSSALPTQRGNVLVALGHFPTAESRALLSATLADPKADSLLRRKAAIGLAHGFGASAIPELAAALASSDVQLRQSAARALAGIPDPAAQAALADRLAIESNASVRDVLAKAVQK